MDRLIADMRRLVAARYPLLYILSHEESRAVEAVRAAVREVPVRVWSLLRGFEDGSGAGDPFAAVREAMAHTRPGAYVFLDLHPFLADPKLVRVLRDFAHGAPRGGKTAFLVMPRPVIPFELEREVALLDVPLPTPRELREIFLAEQQGLASPPAWASEPEAALRAGQGLTAEEAARAFRLGLAENHPDVAIRLIADEKKRILRQSACLEFVEEALGLEAVGGLDALKAWVRTRSKAFGEKARAFGLPPPRGLLLVGVQGCGKSLAAKATAATFRVPLVRLDFAAVFASASPESTLRQALKIAEAMAPVVLWIDEIEKGLGGPSVQATDTRVFGSFLTWLQEKQAPVFVAATANEIEGLPPELARRGRFDDIFFVDLPATRERQEILAIHLRLRGRDPAAYPLDRLARQTEHFSGAELEQVVVSALYAAFSREAELAAQDLERAASEVVPLATTYEEKLAALREWARTRARRASAERKTLELFEA